MGAQKRKEKNETIWKHTKISEFFTSEERSSHKFRNLMIGENIVGEELQLSIYWLFVDLFCKKYHIVFNALFSVLH